MGLLSDIFNSEDGRMALGLLAAGGPQTDINKTGFGSQLQSAVGGVDEWKQNQLKQKMLQMQMSQHEQEFGRKQKEWSLQDQERALARQFYKPGTQGVPVSAGDMGPEPAIQGTNPSFDLSGYASALMGQGDPMKGISILQSLQKDTPFGKIDPKDFTPASIAKFVTTKDYGVLEPVRKLESTEGVVWNPFSPNMEGRTLPNPNKPFSLGAGGEAVPNVEYQNYETSKAAAGAARTQNNLINSGPKAFATELGKLDAEQLGKWREGAQSGQASLSIVKNLRDAEAAGAYSGGTANMRANVANLIDGLTGVTPKGLVGSQMYNAEASKLVLEKIKTLGANPSNADREFIEKTVPQLGQSPQARKQLADFIEQKANQAIDLYGRADKHARANSGLGGFDMLQPTGNNIGGPKPESAAAKSVVKTGLYQGKKVIQYSDGSTEYAN